MNYNNTTYKLTEVSWFKKVREEWGEFSNMAAFPIQIRGIDIRTSEALYQALRFPHMPTLQMEILAQKSPMAAKMKTKPYRNTDTHRLFIDNQIQIMEWCVRMKVAQNYYKFVKLMKTAKTVVENSHKDSFWGAIPSRDNPDILIGKNILGQIWDKIIKEYREDRHSVKTVPSLNINGMYLLDKDMNFEYSIENQKPSQRSIF